MADNTSITPGSGDGVRSIEKTASVKTQVMALDIGGSGAESLLASGNPMPVTGPLTDTQLRATAVPVSLASVPSHAVTGPLTDTQLRATAVPVSLASVPSHAVTGPLTDTQLRATAVPVSGTVTASGPLTDTQLRASVVPVSTPTGASSITVQGTVAHDGVAAQNPVQIAGEARSTDRAAVASADVSRLITDLVGKLVMLPYSIPENTIAGNSTDIVNTTPVSLIAAGGAGIRNYITTLWAMNSHATVGTWIRLTDGSGGPTLWQGYAAPVGGGFAGQVIPPIRSTANTAIYVVCETTGANVRVSASGYRGA